MYVKFAKVRDVKSPERAHEFDGGLDLFIPNSGHFYEKNPHTNDLTIIKGDMFVLRSSESILIPSGIKIEIPNGYCGMICNKSSIPPKKGLIIGSCIIDAGYEGEIHLDLHNVSEKETLLKAGEKIAQILFIPVVCAKMIETQESDLYKKIYDDEKRGTGGFGSTDKK